MAATIVSTEDKEFVNQLLTGLHSISNLHYEQTIESLEQNRDRALPVLLEMVSSVEVNVRCEAAKGIVLADPNHGADLLIPMLDDEDATVRWVICNLIWDCGSKLAMAPLLRVLKEDPDAQVRLTAAGALGEIGDEQSIPDLEWAKEHDHGEDYEGRTVSWGARLAIERILERQKMKISPNQ